MLTAWNIAHIFIVQHKLDVDPCETGEGFDFRLSKSLVRLRKADYALHPCQLPVLPSMLDFVCVHGYLFMAQVMQVQIGLFVVRLLYWL